MVAALSAGELGSGNDSVRVLFVVLCKEGGVTGCVVSISQQGPIFSRSFRRLPRSRLAGAERHWRVHVGRPLIIKIKDKVHRAPTTRGSISLLLDPEPLIM
jgi:hypothetical protein